MTLEDKADILESVEEKLFNALKDYCVGHGCEPSWYLKEIAEVRAAQTYFGKLIHEGIDPKDFAPPERKNPKDFTPPPCQPAPISEPDTAGDTTPTPDLPDKKTVMAALKEARARGVNVADIIRSFGVDNFGDISADKYPAVLDALKAEGAV